MIGRTRLRRRAVLGGTLAAATGAVTGCDAAPDPVTAPPPKTVPVVREDLVEFTDVPGELGFGEAVPLRYPRPAEDTSGALGLVTWLAPVGSTVTRGRPLLRVDDQPLVLLYGPLPAYRALAVGSRGKDVRQLETNLSALGLTKGGADERYTAATAAAVRRWQRALGLPETGTVAPQQVAYAAGPVRIDTHLLRVGDPADGEVLRHTGATRSVALRLDEKRRHLAVPGTTVTVRLADGVEVGGTVDRLGLPTPDPTGEPELTAYVRVADQAALAGAAGQVTVRFTAQRRSAVLTVPVTALVALAEGGYGVQVADGTTTRYVAVRTGLFAGGRVELTAGDLPPGTLVVIPR